MSGFHGSRRKASGAPKKLSIRPLKRQPSLPHNFDEKAWEQLSSALNAIFHREGIHFSLEELYQTVHDLCIQNRSAWLFDRLVGAYSGFISSLCMEASQIHGDRDTFLSLFHAKWMEYRQQLMTVRSIFLYLERVYVMKDTEHRSLWSYGLSRYCSEVMKENLELLNNVCDGLVDTVKRQRNGEVVNEVALKDLIRMLLDLGLYSSHFEERFLGSTTEFYQAEGAERVSSMRISDYLTYVETRLREEQDRVEEYLHASTRDSVMKILHTELLMAHKERVIQEGAKELFEAQSVHDMHRLYELVSRIEKKDELKTVYMTFMQDRGISIVKDKAREKEMVQDLLAFRAKCQEFLVDAFCHGPLFVTAMKNAFEKIMNANGSRPAELLAKYVGSVLQDGGLGKGLSHDELEKKLDDAIIIFRYIQGRDVFEQYYKDGLARRLLLKRSSSMEAEKEMVSKLKQECGSAYTSKLEGMIRDLSTSEDVMNFFSSSVAGTGHEVLSVSVLTTGQWPKFEEHIELVPRSLAMHLDSFSKFYRQKFHGRSISWSFRHSSCTLDASLPSGRYSIIVSFYQAIVLLMFSGRSREEMMSYRQIREETTIKEEELKRVLQSLACSKTRLLKKDPKGRDVGDSDRFCINHAFRHKSKRFRVNQIQSVQTEVEKTATEERILVERVHHIDAAIVRIMKTRKSVLHTHLVHEVFRQTRFQLKGSEVKKRIEGLISQDYIRRDEENANLYHYIA